MAQVVITSCCDSAVISPRVNIGGVMISMWWFRCTNVMIKPWWRGAGLYLTEPGHLWCVDPQGDGRRSLRVWRGRLVCRRKVNPLKRRQRNCNKETFYFLRTDRNLKEQTVLLERTLLVCAGGKLHFWKKVFERLLKRTPNAAFLLLRIIILVMLSPSWVGIWSYKYITESLFIKLEEESLQPDPL